MWNPPPLDSAATVVPWQEGCDAFAPASTSKPGPTDNQVSSEEADRKSTRLNSSHVEISYAVFCSKKKLPSRVQLLTKPAKLSVMRKYGMAKLEVVILDIFYAHENKKTKLCRLSTCGET